MSEKVNAGRPSYKHIQMNNFQQSIKEETWPQQATNKEQRLSGVKIYMSIFSLRF
jgi:hypothetical protein